MLLGERRLDVTHGLRGLWRQPGFTATVVLVLGVAIGVNATLFTVAAGIVWRPWGGVRAPSELVRLYLVDATGPAAGFSLADARTLAGAAKSLAGVSAMRTETVRVGPDDAATTVKAQLVSANFFDVLGVAPILGRRFTVAEDRLGDPAAVAILGHQFWERRFAADRGVVGTLVRINGVPFTVVGVTPPEFTDSEPGYATRSSSCRSARCPCSGLMIRPSRRSSTIRSHAVPRSWRGFSPPSTTNRRAPSSPC
jgi:hypothetical protein